MRTWIIYLAGKWLDLVSASLDCDRDSVRRALIGEGYPTAIVVLPAQY